ncbi:TetR/AcrR family transcriptional regulator [Mesorhizobium sp.]|uniref:TetR/AcrR family transcriptional regulator n=1 Tax=Mesorhizobium sp. TaxID=1871066 RepID=UPI00121D0467|nr:TetR/AcrR family transcriptional regulator [Mesorhizobium sp.]TIO29710.1 MAG: TetR/AcrR family transcriptional regulator [Mesorhizobium sp.]
MTPDERKRMMTEAAISFFARNGISAQTRDLAKYIGVSHALIFKYFGSKDGLLECVFKEVFLEHWNSKWVAELSDRTTSLRDRLVSFYKQYLDVANNYNWIRIVFQASLSNEDLTRRYINQYLSRVLSAIVIEIREVNSCGSDLEPTELEIEKVWIAHASIVYFAIRKHIHETSVMDDTDGFVCNVIDTILPGLISPCKADTTPRNP